MPKILHSLVQQTSAIRTTLTKRSDHTGRPTASERLVRAGLASCRRLLRARSAANLKLFGNETRPSLEPYLGPPESYSNLVRVADDLAAGQVPGWPSEAGSLWYDGQFLIASYRAGAEVGYFLIEDVGSLTPADVRLVGTFMEIFQEQLASALALDLTLDQQHLLSRRTIIAQLRPNDLLYQILKRLRTHLSWRRGACILAPAAVADGEHEDLSTFWTLAAERLTGVKQVSQRIGRRYVLSKAKTLRSTGIVEDLVIDDVGALGRRGATPWQRMIHRVLTERGGLPRELAPARSALVLGIRDFSEDQKRDPDSASYALLISDPRPRRFSQQHLELARSFIGPFASVLEQSARFSRRLIQLWTPAAPLALVEAADEHPDQVEAIDEAVLSAEGPALLGVDALQVVQVRRRGATRVNGSLEILSVVAVEAKEGAPGSHQDAELLNRVQGIHLTDKADVLWNVLTRGEECVEKQPGGVDPVRVGHLFGSTNGVRPYGTVIAVPIESDDGSGVGGALLAYRRKPSEILDIEKLLLRHVASRLGEHFAFRRELADRVRFVSCLSAVAAAPDRASAWRVLVDHARDLLNADHAFLMAEPESVGLRGKGDSRMIVDVAHTWEEGSLSVPPIPLGSHKPGITGTVYATGDALAVPDVSKCKFFVNLLGPEGKPVQVASELAVPIRMPLSAVRPEQPTQIGVLDALWRERHDIMPRDLSTLSALARHAATLLALSASREEAEQMREKLQILLGRSRTLEEAHSEQEVLGWLAGTTGELIDCDLIVIGRHTRGSSDLELLKVGGSRATDLAGRRSLALAGWLGDSLKRFRRGENNAVVDRYDQPSPLRRHIQGTHRDRHQASMAYFMTAADSMAAIQTELRDVWLIWLVRLRPLNFAPKEEALLRLAAELSEAVLRRVRVEIDRARSSHLLEAARDVALDLIDIIHKSPEQLREQIIQRIFDELGASKICIIYYGHDSEAYDFSARFVFPPEAFANDQPPRPDGVSEAVRKIGQVVAVEDVENPPVDFSDPIKRSRFFKRNPQIRSFLAVPLFDRSDLEATEEKRYGGIMYVDFDAPRTTSKSEFEFLATMERFFSECGRLTPRLLWMRDRALQRIQSIHDPKEVFRRVLEVALEELEKEIPASRRKRDDFQLGGNLLMVTPGQEPWARLVTRAGKGETTGIFPGVQNIGEGVAGDVAQTGNPRLIEDTRKPDPGGTCYLPYLKGMRSELAVPIVLPDALKPAAVAKDVIGVLNIESSLPNVFTRRHEKLLSLFTQPPVSLVLYLAERHGQRLWESKKEDDEFLLHAARIVLHDLTRPPRSLLNLAPVIRRKWQGRIPSDINKLLNKIEEEGQHWNDLLKIGLLHLKADVLQSRQPLDVIAQIRSWAAQKVSYKVKVETPPVSDFYIERGHETLLGGVLENLYDNSVRALSDQRVRQSRIWISFHHSAGEIGTEQFLDVLFHDNGPGLPGSEEQWRELFRPFSRRPGEPGKSRGGWGLGLPLVRQMIYLMDGEVEIVGSQPFKNTCFRLRFGARRLT